MVNGIVVKKVQRVPIPDFVPPLDFDLELLRKRGRSGPAGRPRKPRPQCANPLCSNTVRRPSGRFCSQACRFAVMRQAGLTMDGRPVKSPPELREAFRLYRRSVPAHKWPPEVHAAYLEYTRMLRQRRKAAKPKPPPKRIARPWGNIILADDA
jgi:hypothetical protein